MEDIFVERKNIPYYLKNNDGPLVPRANTTAHGTEDIRYVGSRLCQTLPSETKESCTLNL